MENKKVVSKRTYIVYWSMFALSWVVFGILVTGVVS